MRLAAIQHYLIIQLFNCTFQLWAIIPFADQQFRFARSLQKLYSELIAQNITVPKLTGVDSLLFIRPTSPDTRSLTYWKERVMEPFPYMVRGFSFNACTMRLLTTLPSLICIRGPKVLKIRAIATSTWFSWW